MKQEQFDEQVAISQGSDERLILAVSFDLLSGDYKIASCKGSSVNEMAFAMMAVIKSLKNSGYVEDCNDVVDMIQKYLDDPQYGELKNE